MLDSATITARSTIEPHGSAEAIIPARPAERVRTRAGAVSIDMDTLSDYAGGYAFDYRADADPVYTVGLTRFLDLLTRHGIRATLFVIARDAQNPAHAEVLARAVRDGHEIANHTLTHPRRLSGLSDSDRLREIGDAHEILSALAGTPVVGFRAPCYDVCGRTLALLRSLGYRYDSSVHPSMIAPVIDAVVLLKSRLRKWEARPGSYSQLFASLRPYVPANRACWAKSRRRSPGELIELPLSALPFTRIPFYGTWTQTTGMPLFRRSLSWLKRFDVPLNYHFHAVELVGLDDEHVDPRFRVHPGMARPVTEKIRDVDEILASFNRDYQMMTLAELALRYSSRTSQS